MKEKDSRFSLRLSIAGAMVFAVLATSLVLGGLVYGIWRQSMRDNLRERLGELVAVVSLEIEPELHATLGMPGDEGTRSYLALRNRLLEFRTISEDIRYLYTFRLSSGEEYPRFVLDSGEFGKDFSAPGDVYEDITGPLMASFAPPYEVRVEDGVYEDEWGVFMSAYAPILKADGTLDGIVGIDMDASRVASMEAGLLSLILGLTLAIVLCMSIVSSFIAARIVKPLLALADDMRKMQSLRFDSRGEGNAVLKEVSLLQSALENVKKALRSFRKYLPADLVGQLVGMGGEPSLGTTKRELTILFCRLDGFTRGCVRLSPEELVRLSSDYFRIVTSTLAKHGATVNAFRSDRLMAFWNAPGDVPDHALKAARAALEIDRRLSDARRSWETEGLPPLTAHIGLSTGTALVGNVGCEERFSYTAIGEAVDVAAGLPALAAAYGTRILLDEGVVAAIGGRMACRPVDRIPAAGRPEGTVIAELASSRGDWWEIYEAGWRAYECGRWSDAVDRFAEIAAWGEDGPSAILKDRCVRFLSHGVPAGWAGVWTTAGECGMGDEPRA